MREADLLRILERIAPPELALDWDRVGLQAGDPDRDVHTLLLSLDLDQNAIEQAVAAKAELIVSHHPLLWGDVRSLTTSTALGRKLRQLIRAEIDLYVMHTNFDIAPGGLNDALAQTLDLSDCRPLRPTRGGRSLYKLVVFVPPDHAAAVRTAMHRAGAGTIGEYSHCSFRTPGTGTFLPSPKARPHTGQAGKLAEVEEVRLEVLVHAAALEPVLRAMRAAHPYEEVAHDIYPLVDSSSTLGIGRVGRLQAPARADLVVERLGQALDIVSAPRFWGPRNRTVERVAVCSGSGGDFVQDAIDHTAELYLTGDIKYHQAQLAAEAGLVLVDVGHAESERIFPKLLADRLHAEPAVHPALRIIPCPPN